MPANSHRKYGTDNVVAVSHLYPTIHDVNQTQQYESNKNLGTFGRDIRQRNIL
jgi:hypothetical protein